MQKVILHNEGGRKGQAKIDFVSEGALAGKKSVFLLLRLEHFNFF